MSMAGEFVRTELLIGREGLETLENASILVFGVGGVGSHCIEALARCGVGRLILADSDSVAQSNINRQAVAFQDTVGLPKTQVDGGDHRPDQSRRPRPPDPLLCAAGQLRGSSLLHPEEFLP